MCFSRGWWINRQARMSRPHSLGTWRMDSKREDFSLDRVGRGLYQSTNPQVFRLPAHFTLSRGNLRPEFGRIPRHLRSGQGHPRCEARAESHGSRLAHPRQPDCRRTAGVHGSSAFALPLLARSEKGIILSWMPQAPSWRKVRDRSWDHARRDPSHATRSPAACGR